MYVPPVDVASDDDWRRLIDECSFATLVAPGDGPVPVVLPAQYCAGEAVGSTAMQGPVMQGSGPTAVALEAHFHRSNPFWTAVEANPTVVVSLVGPMVFIPHDWNARPDGPAEDGVPTSWYATASLTCIARIIDDEPELASLLTRLSDRYEPVGLDRPVAANTAPYGPLLRAIRGVRLEVVDVVAKAKFGGNRPTQQRRQVAGRLLERDGPGDAAAAAWLHRLVDRQDSLHTETDSDTDSEPGAPHG